MTRRAMVTGLGVIGPLGRNAQEMQQAVVSGASGLASLTHFKGKGIPATAVGEVLTLDVESLKLEYPLTRLDYDRKVFLALVAAKEALESANIQGNTELLKKVGLNLGTSLESFFIHQLLEHSPCTFDINRFLDGYLAVDKNERFLLQTPLDRPSNVVAKSLHLGGPAWVNCSACASGTQSIGHTSRLVRQGRLDIALAGGSDSMLNPLGLGGFSVLGALAPEGQDPQKACRPFDKSREGTVLGEGAAFFVIEEYEHAKARGVKPIAEILGYGASLDAQHISDPCEDGRGAIQAMRAALKDGNVRPDEIDYVSAHGTGTIKNDPMETIAITKVLGEEKAHNTPISSLKSAMGHLIGASGPVEIAGVLGAIKKGLVPATLNLTKEDPECYLDYVPLQPREVKVKTFLKNSFGLGGQNAAVVIRCCE